MHESETERRARQLLQSLEAPPTLRAAVHDVIAERSPSPERSRFRGRRVALASALAAATLAGAALGAQLIDRGPASIPAPASSELRIQASPLLREAGWLYPELGRDYLRAPARGAIALPGIADYGQALTMLVRSLIENGTLPAGARLIDPLPQGVVWREPSAALPAALDLTAPFGFSLPDGRIALPSVESTEAPAGADRALREALRGAGATVSLDTLALRVPELDRCQVLSASGGQVPCAFSEGG